MTTRQIVLDTETTGLRWQDGHRIIEIGCLEIDNRRMTETSFHFYFNPEREIDAGAQQVHGISSEFLADKPLIIEKLDDFIDFVLGAELIIHNASFDIGFLDYELSLANNNHNKSYNKMHEYCKITDSLQLAREKHSGRNSLDALCKRYEVDSSSRTLHGALLDARLLAEVYLKMTSGQKKLSMQVQETINEEENISTNVSSGVIDLVLQEAGVDDLAAHEKFLDFMQQKGSCNWREADSN